MIYDENLQGKKVVGDVRTQIPLENRTITVAALCLLRI